MTNEHKLQFKMFLFLRFDLLFVFRSTRGRNWEEQVQNSFAFSPPQQWDGSDRVIEYMEKVNAIIHDISRYWDAIEMASRGCVAWRGGWEFYMPSGSCFHADETSQKWRCNTKYHIISNMFLIYFHFFLSVVAHWWVFGFLISWVYAMSPYEETQISTSFVQVLSHSVITLTNWLIHRKLPAKSLFRFGLLE